MSGLIGEKNGRNLVAVTGSTKMQHICMLYIYIYHIMMVNIHILIYNIIYNI